MTKVILDIKQPNDEGVLIPVEGTIYFAPIARRLKGKMVVVPNGFGIELKPNVIKEIELDPAFTWRILEQFPNSKQWDALVPLSSTPIHYKDLAFFYPGNLPGDNDLVEYWEWLLNELENARIETLSAAKLSEQYYKEAHADYLKIKGLSSAIEAAAELVEKVPELEGIADSVETAATQVNADRAYVEEALPEVAYAADMAVLSAELAEVSAAIVSGSTVATGYSRTVPQPSGIPFGIRMLCRDPLVPNRLWGQNLTTDRQVGFTDDGGVTFTKVFTPPAGTVAGIPAMRCWNGKMYMIQVPNTGNKRGQIWRSPYPNSSGTGWSWVKIFDLDAPPSNVTTGLNSSFRSDCIAGIGPNVYVVEYSPATTGLTTNGEVQGGPSVFCSPNSGGVWYKVKTFNAKHIHAVAIINNQPWVSMGDAGYGWVDRGLWSANSIAVAGVWTKRSLGTDDDGFLGNAFYPINIIPHAMEGSNVVIGESDGPTATGPLLWRGMVNGSKRPIIEMNKPPLPYLGSMRHITMTPEGNLMWLQTGEQGAISDFDTVMVSRGPHFNIAVPLEVLPAASNLFFSAGDSVLDGHYVWFGHHRIKRPVFAGQTLVNPDPVPNPPIIPDPVIGPDHVWDVSTLSEADGVQITNWTDSVGGRILTRTETSGRPIVDTIASRRVLYFDGDDDWLECMALGLPSQYTVLMRLTTRGVGAAGAGFISANGAGVEVSYNTNARPRMGNLIGTDGQVTLGNRVVAAFVVNGDNSVINYGGNITTGPNGLTTGTNHFRVGYAYLGSAARSAQINLERVHVYRRALQGTELSEAIANLA